MVYVALEPDSDDTIVPEKIQQEIVTYVEETSFPAILAHIEIDCPKLSRCVGNRYRFGQRVCSG